MMAAPAKKRTGGRPSGAQNYTVHDLMALLGAVEAILPIGSEHGIGSSKSKFNFTSLK